MGEPLDVADVDVDVPGGDERGGTTGGVGGGRWCRGTVDVGGCVLCH